MKVENKPDGWHLYCENGEHFGPLATLLELEDLLDLIENRQSLEAQNATRVADVVPHPNSGNAGPTLKYSV